MASLSTEHEKWIILITMYCIILVHKMIQYTNNYAKHVGQNSQYEIP